jgi:hypothetical protein
VHDEIFAAGVCWLSVVAMNASRPTDAFSGGVSGVILRCISDLVLEKLAARRREGGDRDHMAISLARAGRYILRRNASDYAKIACCRTTEALCAASASIT